MTRLILVIIGVVFLLLIPAHQADHDGSPAIIDVGLAAGCFIAAALVPSGRTKNSHTP